MRSGLQIWNIVEKTDLEFLNFSTFSKWIFFGIFRASQLLPKLFYFYFSVISTFCKMEFFFEFSVISTFSKMKFFGSFRSSQLLAKRSFGEFSVRRHYISSECMVRQFSIVVM